MLIFAPVALGGRDARRVKVVRMSRVLASGLISLALLAQPLSDPAFAQGEFGDIPYLQVRINQVLEREPTGAEVEWHNEATGNSGVIRVLRTYFPSPESPCREYERVTRRTEGPDLVVRGTGCRDATGRWRLKEIEEASEPEPEAPTESAAPSAPTAAPMPEESVPAVQQQQPVEAPTSVLPRATESEPAPTAAESPEAPAAEPSPPPKKEKAAEEEVPIDLPVPSE